MPVEVALSGKGNVFVFMTPSGDPTVGAVRAEPDYLYMVSKRRRAGTIAGIVMAQFPFRMSKKEWFAYAPTAGLAGRYEIYPTDSSTLVVHTGVIGAQTTESAYLELIPLIDFEYAYSRAVLTRSIDDSRYDIPTKLFKGIDSKNLAKMESDCLSGKSEVMQPAFDLTGSRKPVWLVNHKPLLRKLTLKSDASEDDVRLAAMRIARSARGRAPELPSEDPIERATYFDVRYIETIGRASSSRRSENVDFTKLEGDSFDYKGDSWTIGTVYPPMDDKHGCVAEVRSEGGFVSGISQKDMQKLLLGQKEVQPEWTSLHRRNFFESRIRDQELGKKLTNKEFTSDEYMISVYEVVEHEGNRRFKRLQRCTWEAWKRKRAASRLSKLHKKKREKRIGNLSSLKKASNTSIKKTPENPMSKLAHLKRKSAAINVEKKEDKTQEDKKKRLKIGRLRRLSDASE